MKNHIESLISPIKYFILLIALFGCFSLPVMAQDDEEQEESGNFFGDGLNESRFESNYDKSYESTRPNYEYHSNIRNEDNNTYNQSQQIKDLDIEVNKAAPQSGAIVIGGGAGNGNANNYQNYASPGSIVPGTNIPQAGSTGGGPNPSFPDPPGDPDVPIDRGSMFLILVGLGYGIYKRYKFGCSKDFLLTDDKAGL